MGTALDGKADKTAVNDGLALKADIPYVDDRIAEMVFGPPIDCSDLLTMYKGDTTLTESPPINAKGCTSLKDVFKDCSNLKTVGYIHCPNATSMRSMFQGCSSLTTIPSLDTSSVTNMAYMFYHCSSLTTIPPIDTSSVTYVGYMFEGCSVLTSVTFECDDVRPYVATMFYSTPIASGNGYIFVPDNLVQAYRTAEGWLTHASVIYGHSDKESMTSQVQQMAAMNIENKPTVEELQLMMQGSDEKELN